MSYLLFRSWGEGSQGTSAGTQYSWNVAEDNLGFIEFMFLKSAIVLI